MSTTRRAGVCLLVACACALVACSSSYGAATAPAADTDAGDASAAGDGPPVTSDGGGDPTDAGDAGSCAPAPATCTGGPMHSLDFSSPELPPASFGMQTENATVTHVAAGRCGAGAMHVEANVPAAGGAIAQGMIARTEFGSFSSVHFAFSFRGPKPTTDGYAIFGCTVSLIAADPSTARTTVFVDIVGAKISMRSTVRDGDGSAVAGFEPVTLDAFVGDAEAATWRTFDARLTLQASTVRVVATFDGVAQPEQSAQLAATVARVNVDCGVPYADHPGTYAIDLDDVLIEACP